MHSWIHYIKKIVHMMKFCQCDGRWHKPHQADPGFFKGGLGVGVKISEAGNRFDQITILT